ncbi:hypothetical protein L1887_62019 [Cichorium endivia]|nr:hypothetical protein L1887_62019 [Cichorium endivia]
MNALAVQVGRCWRDGRVVDVECMAVEAQENCHTIKAATARSENSNTQSAAGTARCGGAKGAKRQGGDAKRVRTRRGGNVESQQRHCASAPIRSGHRGLGAFFPHGPHGPHGLADSPKFSQTQNVPIIAIGIYTRTNDRMLDLYRCNIQFQNLGFRTGTANARYAFGCIRDAPDDRCGDRTAQQRTASLCIAQACPRSTASKVEDRPPICPIPPPCRLRHATLPSSIRGGIRSPRPSAALPIRLHYNAQNRLIARCGQSLGPTIAFRTADPGAARARSRQSFCPALIRGILLRPSIRSACAA